MNRRGNTKHQSLQKQQKGRQNKMSKQYETVIGLEVHVELATKTKIFCACSTAFGGAPNTHTCPVCTGMPGSLPVLNKQVVEYALAVGLATNCQIHQYCKFDRKNYFYPDNPQNYQISQLYLPICHDGGVEIETAGGKKIIGIHEIHMEEDAGKLVHDEWEDCSLVDYNRSGVPLIEIVSEPDMRSAEEVIAYLEKLRQIIQYLGASDCKLQEGSMRADVNLSVREVGAEKFGTRTEMKNLNSFKAIAHAIEGERERQIELIEAGRKVIQETRRWDDNKESSFTMRSKEDAQDYRYFPDPDLTPVVISDEWIAEVKARQPELRSEKLERYKKEFDIPNYDAQIITNSKHMADLFEAATAICKKPKKVSNWLMGETLRLLKENNMDPEDLSFAPENLAKLVDLADAGTVNSSVAKEVFEQIFKENVDPEVYIEEHGLKTVNDEGALKATIEQIVSENPQSVADYKGGKKKAIGFLVGQTMKAMKGKADPASVNKILKEILDQE
jgi:aspartyl-tRNA(Asn)/glutamyl-tRNA(Gln) amidotransferase subunit B